MRLPLVSLILSSALAGCMASGSGGLTYSGGAYVTTPDLVTVSPGVQVVADYDDSVFYSDGFYWRYDGGGWYRSNNYAGGFVYWDSPPQAIITINNPGRYRHYRPNNYTPRHQPYRRPEPLVRDHRSPERRSEPPRPEPRPVVRDHREPERRAEPPRAEPPPVVRDHREEHAPPPPVVRDHRDNTPPGRKGKGDDHDRGHERDHH